MANFGQMLAAAQAYAAPQEQRAMAQSQSQQKEFEVEKEKKSQLNELQALMEAEMKRASDKKGPFGGLGKIGKLVSFFNPAVGAAFETLSATGQAGAQKKALKKLMKDPKFAKYKGTWLDDPTKLFMKDVKGLASDIDPLMTGLTSFATSKVTGDIAKGIGDKFKGAFAKGTPMEELGISEQITGKAGGVGIRPDLLGKGGALDLSKTLDPRFAPGGVEGIGGKFDVLSDTENIMSGGGLKDLFKDFDLMDIIGEAGEGAENLQSIPLLMQLFGDKQGGMEFDPRSYF